MTFKIVSRNSFDQMFVMVLERFDYEMSFQVSVETKAYVTILLSFPLKEYSPNSLNIPLSFIDKLSNNVLVIKNFLPNLCADAQIRAVVFIVSPW